jgi:RNA polymerase sigma-70 factor, ECF subfamily
MERASPSDVRLCLDNLGSARRRRETYVGVWLPEPLAGDPRPDETVALTESLSMAFLTLLESLTPAERVAFLLRDVFDYDYDEIASIVRTTAGNARQLVSRARKAAIARADMPALLEVLGPAVVAYTDGGGKASAALKPIAGPDRVARFFLGLAAKMPSLQVTWEVKTSARVPALWLYEGGHLSSVLHLALDEEGRIEGGLRRAQSGQAPARSGGRTVRPLTRLASLSPTCEANGVWFHNGATRRSVGTLATRATCTLCA